MPDSFGLWTKQVLSAVECYFSEKNPDAAAALNGITDIWLSRPLRPLYHLIFGDRTNLKAEARTQIAENEQNDSF